MTNLAGAPTASRMSLVFTYDYQGRRAQKIVSTNKANKYVGAYTNRYAYDGWNCVAVLSPTLAVVESFQWGSDLSGSMQGAGGVGGLILVSYYGAAKTNCFVACDGNGNVSALVNAANGATVANYEYGPFGELIRATGPMAKVNPFRFSTKYDDDESDFLYYGYRYYNPSTGRWLSRDPIAEKGGRNLYGFVSNDPLNKIDPEGLSIIKVYYADGSTERIWFPTLAKFTALLNRAASSGKLIDRLHIRGHGAADVIYIQGGGPLQICGPIEYITVRDGQIQDNQKTDLTPLFRNALTSIALVVLDACHTAPMAQKVSVLLPNRTIGGPHWFQFGCPWEAYGFEPMTFYLNGQEVYYWGL